jgi:hypothetical protein
MAREIMITRLAQSRFQHRRGLTGTQAAYLQEGNADGRSARPNFDPQDTWSTVATCSEAKNHEHTCGHARNAHFQSRQTLIDTQALTCTTETAPCTDGFRPPRHLSGARADTRVCPKTARGGPARTCTHCLTCATGHVPSAGTARAPAPRLTTPPCPPDYQLLPPHWRSCFEYASVDHSCW